MSLKRFVISSALGNYLEFFDFTLYGFCAPLIAHLFFPKSNPEVAILLVWGIFAISFAVRPIGALFFGYIGDYYGRRVALVSSILLMSTATILFGLLPTYASWGIFAPISLIFIRMLQGFAVSAEYNGGSIYIIESGTKFRGFLCSLTSFSCGLGILTASFIMMMMTRGFTAETLPEWRWRLPFIAGGIIIGVTGYILRRNMRDTHGVEQNETIKNPLLLLVKNEKLPLLKNFLVSGYNGVSAYIIYTYISSYLQTELHINIHEALKFSTFGTALSISSALFFGFLSDFFGRKQMMTLAASAMVCLAIPMFSLINTGEPWAIFVGVGVMAICGGAFGGPMNAAIVEMFAKHNRYTGTSLGYNLGVTLLGGTAPFIISLLLNTTKNQLIVPIYLIIFAIAAISALWFLKQERKISLVSGEIS